ncbi:SusC/RagA family TonB-linked outer membrane protein [Mariniphaga anaerophila]|nr:TonB-dependent receptor [Mariniphaga anaerophila]
MKKIQLTVFTLLIVAVGWAQKLTVKGIVSDNGEPLPGATVIVKNALADQKRGTVTDFEGRFSLDVETDNVLIISFVGYKTEEIQVDGQTFFKINLTKDFTELEQVVVVGYGVQQKASSIASISQTDGEELLRAGNVTTVSQALQGMLPGVTAIVDNGKPGADAADIFIRGKASWQSSSPLVLVDGVERDMNDIDPNEIETLSVLKDASATAVFGVKGGNGVILVTTKRGKVSAPDVGFSANFGFKMPTVKPEYGDYVTAMELWNEALINDKEWDKLIPESTIDAWRKAYSTGNYGAYNDYFPQIDWWNEMIDVGYQRNYNVNIRGGTSFVKYFASLGYLYDGDIFNSEENELFDPSFNYKRYNWRSNFDFNLTKTTVLSVNIAGKLGYRNQAGYRIDGNGEDGWGQEQFFQALYRSDQNTFPIKYSDGEWGTAENGEGNLMTAFDKGQRIYKYYQGFVDFKLEQKLDAITEGLSVKGTVSFDSESANASRIQRYSGGNFGPNAISYHRKYDYANPNSNGTYPLLKEERWPSDNAQNPEPSASYDYMLGNGFRKFLYYEIALNYARSFGDHNVSALALFSRRENEGLSGTTTFRIPHRQEDWVGRVTYNWNGRYLAEINGAYNGSENFAPGMRFGFFPSVSAGWRVSEEPFVKQFAEGFLTNLKLKYSYGMSGMDNGANRFGYQQSYNTGGSVQFGETNSTSYGPLYTEGNAANENATWEEAIKQNYGLEITLWSKLSGAIDIYNEKRTNILMDLWSPIWYVQKAAKANIGETKNQGTEIELAWNDKIGSNWEYRIKGNVAFNENRIVARGDGVNTPEYQRQAGKPIGFQTRYLVYDFYSDLDDIFIYSTPNNTTLQGQIVPGDFMYVDYNADGVIDQDGDRVVIRELSYPLKTYGLTLGCGYKGWNIDMTWYGVTNMSKELDKFIYWDNVDGGNVIYKVSPDATNRWTPENADSATKPVLHSVNTSFSMMPSTYTNRDASYIRLKNVEISYTFNKKFLQQFGVKNFRIYGNGNNLITLTNLDKRIDPESKSSGVYPVVKRMNIGVRASF